MHEAWKPLIAAACILTTIASGAPPPPEKPKQPILGTLEYRLGRTLDEQPVTHVRVTSIAGERCYRDTNSVQQSHAFVFDDNRDRITVNITDVNGVSPGQTYEHRLFFKRPDGSIKNGGVFEIELSNPFSATEPRYAYTIELSVDNANPRRRIRTGTVLGGIYELSETQRNMAVDLQYLLETDIEYTDVCSDYN